MASRDKKDIESTLGSALASTTADGKESHAHTVQRNVRFGFAFDRKLAQTIWIRSISQLPQTAVMCWTHLNDLYVSALALPWSA